MRRFEIEYTLPRLGHRGRYRTLGSTDLTGRTKFLNRLLLTLLFAFVALLTACDSRDAHREISPGWTSVSHAPNSSPELEAHELTLREFIFRENVSQWQSDEVVFLSFGRAADSNWEQAPDGFLSRFDRVPIDLRCVSDANLYTSGLTSKTDNKAGIIYFVKIVEWIDATTVKVDHGFYGGLRYGGGAEGETYQLVDGTWQLLTAGQSYLS